jgi:hypothetical protein
MTNEDSHIRLFRGPFEHATHSYQAFAIPSGYHDHMGSIDLLHGRGQALPPHDHSANIHRCLRGRFRSWYADAPILLVQTRRAKQALRRLYLSCDSLRSIRGPISWCYHWRLRRCTWNSWMALAVYRRGCGNYWLGRYCQFLTSRLSGQHCSTHRPRESHRYCTLKRWWRLHYVCGR